jgi:ABC-type microcin C transport system permease subunit YejB
MPRRAPPPAASPRPSPSRRVLSWWYGLVGVGGFAFGIVAERRPFGTDMLAHPLIVFFVVVGVGLLGLRAALRRPVPDVIPDRQLFVGCLIGLVAFLIGNWVGTHLVALS